MSLKCLTGSSLEQFQSILLKDVFSAKITKNCFLNTGHMIKILENTVKLNP